MSRPTGRPTTSATGRRTTGATGRPTTGRAAASDEVPAGPLGPWLDATLRTLRVRAEADVPCGTCTACCTASQFVHIAPDETDTLAHVPRALRFAAPGLPKGHVLLPYDERGHCPMLVDGTCSIYDHRPRTCRTYDCRVFAATGTLPGEASKAGIASQAVRWRFTITTPEEQQRLDAMHAASAFLRSHPGVLRDSGIPENPTQVAVTAIAIHERFLAEPGPSLAEVVDTLRRWVDEERP